MIGVRVVVLPEYSERVAFVMDRRDDGYFMLYPDGQWRKVAEIGTGAFAFPKDSALPLNEALP